MKEPSHLKILLNTFAKLCLASENILHVGTLVVFIHLNLAAAVSCKAAFGHQKLNSIDTSYPKMVYNVQGKI